jgi:hypothetical protein
MGWRQQLSCTQKINRHGGAMAKFDFPAFGAALAERLHDLGYSLDRAERQWPETNKAMLSRAVNGTTLSVDSVLTICRFAGLDPFEFLGDGRRRRFTRKSILKQAVTAAVQRETGETCHD